MPLGALIGSLVSAGAGLLGGSMSRDAGEKAQRQANLQNARFNQRQIRLQRRANVRDWRRAKAEIARQDAWARRNMSFQNRWARRNEAAQREFAQQGLRWRVRDAKRAGVHPVYALGMQGAGYSPVSVVGAAPGSSGFSEGVPALSPVSAAAYGDPMGSALASAGQDIGRAISAMQTPQERLADELKLANMGLQNELLKAQIASHVGTGPGLPSWSSSAGVGPYKAWGAEFFPSPHTSDASVIQNRHGEWAEGLWGAVSIPADLDYTLGQRIGVYPHEWWSKGLFGLPMSAYRSWAR